MKSYLIWILLITGFLFSRFYNLGNLPLFSDEGYAVVRAWELKQTGDLLGMIKYTTQPVFIWLIALFQFLPFNNVTSGRLVSGVLGLATALIVSTLAGKWIGRKAMIPAFILMAALPFSVFYDRTILFESATLFFMVLALVFPVATGLAILTKQTGWLILPLVLVLGKGDLKERAAKISISILAVIAVWYLAVGGNFSIVGSMIGKTASPVSVSANFKNNLLRSKLWLIDYLTWPVIWLSVIGGVAAVAGAIRQKKVTPILVIAGWTLGIFLFVNKTAVIFYPRYLYSIVLGVVLLAVKGWEIIRIRWPNKIVLSGLFMLILLPGIVSDWKIMTTPQKAEIPREDGFQFFEDWTSGVGGRQLADKISEIAGLDKINVYLEEDNSYFVILKSDQRLKNAKIEITGWLIDPLTEIPENVLEDDRASLFIRNRHPDIPADWPVELVWSYPKTDKRSVYLYKIIK
jgi:4-amino-4-deoxy-L-arabinose transferase-like glycosyltransferase